MIMLSAILSSGRIRRLGPLPMSKAEVQVAKNYSKPELAIVAANISLTPRHFAAVFTPKEKRGRLQTFPLFFFIRFLLL